MTFQSWRHFPHDFSHCELTPSARKIECVQLKLQPDFQVFKTFLCLGFFAGMAKSAAMKALKTTMKASQSSMKASQTSMTAVNAMKA